MNIVKGIVVKAIAGRDNGNFFAVKEIAEEGYVLICDGKSRKLEKPKKKNVKHLRITNTVIDTENITNKKLKMILRSFADQGNESEV